MVLSSKFWFFGVTRATYMCLLMHAYRDISKKRVLLVMVFAVSVLPVPESPLSKHREHSRVSLPTLRQRRCQPRDTFELNPCNNPNNHPIANRTRAASSSHSEGLTTTFLLRPIRRTRSARSTTPPRTQEPIHNVIHTLPILHLREYRRSSFPKKTPDTLAQHDLQSILPEMTKHT